jgi:hypothetical protein
MTARARGSNVASLRMRQIEVVAQDPSVRKNNRILTAMVSIPYDDLDPGPRGYAVHVIDYDATTQTMYRPVRVPPDEVLHAPASSQILGDPVFHAINAYALVMLTLHRFEFALGRRIGWGTEAPQLKVVPHAFEVGNAFYSEDAEALLFGYIRSGPQPTFLALSHDIVVHETTHALIDGLRDRFTAPSSPDQAALHEGLADVVALLSVFSLKEVIGYFIDEIARDGAATGAPQLRGFIRKVDLTRDRLEDSVLLGLAEEMRDDVSAARVNALRRSVKIDPATNILDRLEFQESHRRGEVFVAAVLSAFLDMWERRLQSLGSPGSRYVSADRVAEEGVMIADLLLTTVIRAIDYTPPIHIEFGDFLSAMLTGDHEVRSDDTRYDLRGALTRSFAGYGISPASPTADGTWQPPNKELKSVGLHLGSLQTDETEMFRLIWANRDHLELDKDALTRIVSLRPCFRVSPEDGTHIQETVIECTQYLKVQASQLGRYGLVKPPSMPEREVVLEGGSTLVLDEYGKLKYEIYNPLPRRRDDPRRQQRAQRRLDYLWNNGFMDRGARLSKGLAALHRRRAMGLAADTESAEGVSFDSRAERWI